MRLLGPRRAVLPEAAGSRLEVRMTPEPDGRVGALPGVAQQRAHHPPENAALKSGGRACQPNGMHRVEGDVIAAGNLSAQVRLRATCARLVWA
jgi:hypothetical protein